MFTLSADLYDAIYHAQGKDYTKESQRILEIIKDRGSFSKQSLLDVACGTGGHLQPMSAHFNELAGIDLDPNMVEYTRTKVPNAVISQGDMVNFNLNRKFDVVICMFSSIGYVKTIDRLKKTIKNFQLHTNQGGFVLVEPWIFPENVKTGLIHVTNVDQPELKISRMAISHVQGQTSRIEFQYLKGTPSAIEHFTEIHDLTLFERSEYETAFQEAGLQVEFLEEGLTGRGLFIATNPLTF